MKVIISNRANQLLEGNKMKEHKLTTPIIALIGSTRGMLGAGLAFLLANKLRNKQRKKLGWTLFLVGAASTLPLAKKVLGRA